MALLLLASCGSDPVESDDAERRATVGEEAAGEEVAGVDATAAGSGAPTVEEPVEVAALGPVDPGPSAVDLASEMAARSRHYARFLEVYGLVQARSEDAEAAMQELVEDLRASLVKRAVVDPVADDDAVVYMWSLGVAWQAGWAGTSELAAMERLAAPILEHGPPVAIASVAFITATAAANARRNARALELLEDAERRGLADDPNRPRCLNLYSHLLARTGRLQEAQRWAGEALRASYSADDADGAARAHLTRAKVAFDAGLVDRALVELQLSLKMSERLGTSTARVEMLETQVDLVLNLRRYDRVDRLTRDLDGIEARPAAILRTYRASALRRLPGRLDEADELFGALLDGVRLPRELISHCHYSRTLIALDRGDLDEAWLRQQAYEAAFPVSVERFDSGEADVTDYNVVAVGSRLRVDRLAAVRRDGESEAPEFGDPDSTDPEVGSELDLERWRGLHEAAFQAMLRRWDSLGVRDGGAGFLRLDRWRRVAGELASLRRAMSEPGQGAEAAFEVALELHAHSSMARSLDATQLEAGDLQAGLRPDHGLLVFLPAARSCLVFAVDRGGIRCFELTSYTPLQEAAGKLQTALSAPSPQAAEVAKWSERASRWLWADELVEALGGWRRITVCGADLLGDLPVEILSLPAPVEVDGVRTRTVGEVFAIEHTASLSGWDRLRDRGREGAETSIWATLTPADEVVEGVVAAQLGAERLEALAESCAPVPVTITAAEDFTVSALLGAELSDVYCLHLLCHGAWDDSLEIGSILAVAPDERYPKGRFHAALVEDLPRVPPLVFLSACRAGKGHGREGDGSFATLAGAFLRGGARSVVVSRGDLDLNRHLVVVRAFHQARAEGVSPAEALRRGRLALAGGRRDPELLRELRIQLLGWGGR